MIILDRERCAEHTLRVGFGGVILGFLVAFCQPVFCHDLEVEVVYCSVVVYVGWEGGRCIEPFVCEEGEIGELYACEGVEVCGVAGGLGGVYGYVN